MDTNYGMEIVRATEIAALTAARLQGLGDHRDILNQTRKAITKTLNRLSIEGVLINDRFINRPEVYQLPSILGKGGEKTDVMTIALEAYRKRTSFLELLLQKAEVTNRIDGERLTGLFDPAYYLRNVDSIYQRAGLLE